MVFLFTSHFLCYSLRFPTGVPVWVNLIVYWGCYVSTAHPMGCRRVFIFDLSRLSVHTCLAEAFYGHLAIYFCLYYVYMFWFTLPSQVQITAVLIKTGVLKLPSMVSWPVHELVVFSLLNWSHNVQATGCYHCTKLVCYVVAEAVKFLFSCMLFAQKHLWINCCSELSSQLYA